MAISWTRARNPDTGGEAIVPVDSMPGLQARGWEPFGDPAGDRAELVRQVDQEAADAAEAAAAHAEDAAAAVEGGDVASVLDAVGQDPGAARAALDAERGKAKPRTTLIAQLEKIATADGQPPADQEAGPAGG